MLRNKSTKVFSETNNFFTSTEKGIFRIMELYRSLKLHKLNFGITQAPQSIHLKEDIMLGLLLFPIYSIKNVHSYCKQALCKFLEAKKNTFYRFKNDYSIEWRNIIDKCNKKLFNQLDEIKLNHEGTTRCLIVDDTDFEKTSYKTEHVGKIWSHVKHSHFFGFKGLFLALWDGKSLFSVDFSLHMERGKNKKKPFGLTPKQKKKQFSKQRAEGSAGQKREAELFVDKISTAVSMVKKAVKKGLKADYLLMDSWFFCDKFLKMVSTLSTSMNIVGMVKMAKAKYEYKGKSYTAKEIGQLLKRGKKVKWVNKLQFYSAETEVLYKSTPLKLYFCKTTKHGKWHLLASTNIALGILKAYEIYSIRWGIEVFFKESKQYFGLGKSQSQDFDAQIADISIAIIEYNVFSLAKRIEAYQTIGGLFEQVKDQAMELTIAQRIWGFILELLRIIADLIDGDFNELIIKIIKNKPEDNKIFRLIESQLSMAA
jgi:hypothetical protein